MTVLDAVAALVFAHAIWLASRAIRRILGCRPSLPDAATGFADANAMVVELSGDIAFARANDLMVAVVALRLEPTAGMGDDIEGLRSMVRSSDGWYRQDRATFLATFAVDDEDGARAACARFRLGLPASAASGWMLCDSGPRQLDPVAIQDRALRALLPHPPSRWHQLMLLMVSVSCLIAVFAPTPWLAPAIATGLIVFAASCTGAALTTVPLAPAATLGAAMVAILVWADLGNLAVLALAAAVGTLISRAALRLPRVALLLVGMSIVDAWSVIAGPTSAALGRWSPESPYLSSTSGLVQGMLLEVPTAAGEHLLGSVDVAAFAFAAGVAVRHLLAYRRFPVVAAAAACAITALAGTYAVPLIPVVLVALMVTAPKHFSFSLIWPLRSRI